MLTSSGYSPPWSESHNSREEESLVSTSTINSKEKWIWIHVHSLTCLHSPQWPHMYAVHNPAHAMVLPTFRMILSTWISPTKNNRTQAFPWANSTKTVPHWDSLVIDSRLCEDNKATIHSHLLKGLSTTVKSNKTRKLLFLTCNNSANASIECQLRIWDQGQIVESQHC